MYFLGVPVAVFAFLALEEPPGEREPRSLVYLRRVTAALTAREAFVLYGSAFVIDFSLFGAVFTVLPFLFEEMYELSAVLIGLVITTGEIASTVSATQNGRLARRVSDYGIITIGFVVTGIGLVGAWLAPTPFFIAVATLGFGAGWGLAFPSIDAGVSDLVPPQFRAGALSLCGSSSFLGRAGGPILFTSFAAQNGYRVLLLLAGVGAFVYAAVLMVLTR